MLLRVPGVYRPQSDTHLLSDAISDHAMRLGTRAIDLCTGTGAVAIHAARCGAARVTAVDVSRRAAATALVNARLARADVEVRRGDLAAPVAGREFDLVLSNPPYVPTDPAAPPPHGAARAWDAGGDGRSVLDRICRAAPQLLAPGGTLLLVQSALSGVEKTLAMLAESGVPSDVHARRSIPLGPVLRSRQRMLVGRGLLDAAQRTEDIVVIRGVKPS
ncbi:methyltransferase domain-containing protein [Rhodococcus rhodnii]|uniref:Methyltransferase n=2 Tax=Rhodococcus rhodnii TaxID=38312 RepID=R7WJL0_9NOCA|nr:HemK2/MTQ2 family protein methyltransferase [Rhodococcus rhodnii]EOM75496.1 methyltransferase [Rhodococcus rhodnii LMG 5362]TXG90490.1 methyltransferase domain-containing protein [Rhodococcus rhodnii]